MGSSPIDITNFNIADLYELTLAELRDVAAFLGVDSPTKKSKKELVELTYKAKCGEISPVQREGRGRPNRPPKNSYYIDWKKVPELSSEQQTSSLEHTFVAEDDKNELSQDSNVELGGKVNADCKDFAGYLDVLADGFGFIRKNQYQASDDDAYIGSKLIKRYGLRTGDYITGVGKKQYEGKSSAIVYVSTVNGKYVNDTKQRPSFDSLVPIYPDEKYVLEGQDGNISMRCIDLMCPIGKGQRALVVAPPKAGKTTLIKDIAKNIKQNNPDIKLYMLLIDERPEEVTDIKRSVDGEIIFSTFDESCEHHVRVSEVVLEKAKRDVEEGKDVVIIMDSLTRLARAYNVVTNSNGKTLSGGLDPQALQYPKKFFGAGRNIENGGSLTIIATAIVDTGSRMDDVIFEEFKGTGNMELHLSRKLAELRLFPAIDIAKSSTRKEDLLLGDDELKASYIIRSMVEKNEIEATKYLINLIKSTKNNAELCEKLINNNK